MAWLKWGWRNKHIASANPSAVGHAVEAGDAFLFQQVAQRCGHVKQRDGLKIERRRVPLAVPVAAPFKNPASEPPFRQMSRQAQTDAPIRKCRAS